MLQSNIMRTFEIQLQIIEKLDIDDVLNYSQCCGYFYITIINNKKLWQFLFKRDFFIKTKNDLYILHQNFDSYYSNIYEEPSANTCSVKHYKFSYMVIQALELFKYYSNVPNGKINDVISYVILFGEDYDNETSKFDEKINLLLCEG